MYAWLHLSRWVGTIPRLPLVPAPVASIPVRWGRLPLALTRPVFDLLCGQTSLAAKQCRAFAPCLLGTLVRPALAELVRQQRRGLPVNDPAWLAAAPAVLVNGRWLPPARVTPHLGGP